MSQTTCEPWPGRTGAAVTRCRAISAAPIITRGCGSKRSPTPMMTPRIGSMHCCQRYRHDASASQEYCGSHGGRFSFAERDGGPADRLSYRHVYLFCELPLTQCAPYLVST